tara:strand:- start:1474 stop:3024 length:1551 start_codon:yes stop_codon:yes gene_type:complete
MVETFTDKFALWQFGEFDYIDPIKSLQDGRRTRFPLKYEKELVSIESNPNFDVDLNSILLIFRNRVMQEPIETYDFIGGTSINFKIAPRPEDDIHIFFYKGTDGVDSTIVDAPVRPIELGDELKVISEPPQDSRIITEFARADTVRTNTYRGSGITADFTPVEVTKQKHDLIVDGEIISKTRELIESQIIPTAKIISNYSNSDTQLFIDSPGPFFNYESEENPEISVRIVSESLYTNQTPAEIRATVSNAGTISNLTIVDGGSGYTSAPTVKIQKPPVEISVGVGVTATATLTISNGSVNGFTITESGLGYSQSNPPQVIVDTPNVKFTEVISGITSIRGNTGIVTGIQLAQVGLNRAIKFTLTLDPNESEFDTEVFKVGNPIFIYDTEIGTGTTSINDVNNVVNNGTEFVDNIYLISQVNFTGQRPNPVIGIVTCKIKTDIDIATIPTTVGYSTDPIGKFSVGILTGANITRSSNPISIDVSGFEVNSGLTTFPTVQRFSGDQTFNKTGAIKIKI